MSDLGFEELPPGRYAGTVEKVRYTFTATTRIIITYRLDTPDGIRRVDERFLIGAPPSSASHYQTTQGLGRVEDILRIRGLTLADAEAAGGLKSLPDCSKASRSASSRGTGARPGSTAPSWCASKNRDAAKETI